eukprot:jgi/Chlat1/5590/Chrsp369S05367
MGMCAWSEGRFLWTIAEAAAALAKRSVSAEELLQACQKRIEAGRSLNAFITETPQHAAHAASTSDTRREHSAGLGPLDGIPIAIKDNFCTHGVRTTAASNMLQTFISPYESTVTQRLQAAGAVMIGKTNMDEFGMGSYSLFSAFGHVSSGWRVQGGANEGAACVAGGSSGGSAVAVASGMALAAIGSDTGGSVRLPAAYCGLVGFKPSYGRLSRFGLIAFTSSLDTPGIFTRSVEDTSLVLQAIEGCDANDSTCLPIEVPRVHSLQQWLSGKQPLAGLRVGIPQEYHVEEVASAVLEAWQNAARQMQDAGAELVHVGLPHTKAALAAYYVLAPAEAASNLARYDGVRYGHRCEKSSDSQQQTLLTEYALSRGEAFGPEVRRRIVMGTFAASSEAANKYHHKALQIRRLVAQDFANAFMGIDILLTPTAPTTAPLLSEALAASDPTAAYANDVMTIPSSLAGLPAMSLPVALDASNGLPVGLQLIAPRLQESKLLSVAAVLEHCTVHHTVNRTHTLPFSNDQLR